MAAPVISTDATQVRTYAATAETELGSISTSLTDLVNACVSVPYWGNNGKDFKTKTGTAATDMSESIWKAIDRFTQAVNDANKAIAQSLGGDVTIDGVPKPTVTVPAISMTGPAGETGEGLYPSAMTDLQTTVNAKRDQITQAAENHRSALTSQTPGWQGNQKETAVGACAALTQSISTAVTQGFSEINQAIEAQNASTASADA